MAILRNISKMIILLIAGMINVTCFISSIFFCFLSLAIFFYFIPIIICTLTCLAAPDFIILSAIPIYFWVTYAIAGIFCFIGIILEKWFGEYLDMTTREITDWLLSMKKPQQSRG